MNKIQLFGMSLAVATALSFSGCGSSSDDTTTSDTQTGTFVDAPVQGLSYTTATQTGFTDEKGNFLYKTGETVEFKLGTLSLGAVPAGNVITPYTIAEAPVGADNDKATNIALLLQNLDANRENGDVLDLSNLKDFNFSDINLSAPTADMEATISNKIQAGDFDGKIDANAVIITAADVKANMDSYVTSIIQDELSFSKTEGITYGIVECSDLIGCEQEEGTSIKFENNVATITDPFIEGTETSPYTIDSTDKTIVKIDWDWGTEYAKVISISSDMAGLCTNNATLEAAQACTKINLYMTTSDDAANSLVTNSVAKLDSKTLVTNFSDIQDINLNQYEYEGNAFSTWTIKINQDGSVTGDDDIKNIAFSDGTITATVDEDGEEETEVFKVYKYDLAGKTIKLSEFADSSIFDADTPIPDGEDREITFTDGAMYCHIVFWECFVDDAALNQMIP